ncbi:FG-GAP repeat domain-containing protein [Thiocapsa bogorovii]|uniref:FG-GAP repeat domain-containing protein n=1 Tax=Thiocapsa bogorovii TaxID=521689 RepID=UPI001E57F511|nr:VCBS repeat-containing protein [Thiocapsa bogorovii]UHD14505.1 VCBS repeat-containing protein [Thiocapsa bogorovii]
MTSIPPPVVRNSNDVNGPRVMGRQSSGVMVSIIVTSLVIAIPMTSDVRIARADSEVGAEVPVPLAGKNSSPDVVGEPSELEPLAPAALQPWVTVVESAPARRVIGSVSMPEGSPWCDGKPTYWLVGHDNTPETPWCQQSDGSWTQPGIAVLDTTDSLNAIDGPDNIDRHDCASLDINDDAFPDLVCVVGANKGEGLGFNEVYVTKADGGLSKILEGHGLHKYPSMRTRFVVPLDAADGGKLLFIANRGAPRADGKTNAHRLFRLDRESKDGTPAPYFHEVDSLGPWVLEYKVSFALAADISHDGIADLVVGDENGSARFFIQSGDMRWRAINLGDMRKTTTKWNNARVADVTNDGVADLIVVGSTHSKRAEPYLRIYAGNPDLPYLFDFDNPVFEYRPKFDAVDLAVLDVNRDGLLDVYVVQNDQSKGTYCGPRFNPRDWWGRGPQPPKVFVPPIDKAQDLLFLGESVSSSYTPLRLEHAFPGCGGIVEEWNQHSLILAQGNFAKPGDNLLLEW